MRKWLIELRKANHYSQKEIAELVNISQPSYCNIENGERNPSIETAKRIGEILGFSWTIFYEEKSERACAFEGKAG